MKRLAKILIITVLTLVFLLAVGVWALNRWLKSPDMHAHVERELSKALRVPLKFKSLKLSLWGGMQAKGITVPDEKGNFFEVGGFTAKHRLLSLLRGRLVFENVVVDSPKIVIVQRKDGSWQLPPLPPDLQAEIDAGKKPKTASKGEQPKAPKTNATPKPKSGPDISIAKIEITNGSVEMFDKDGKPYVTANGLRAAMTNVTSENIEGWVNIAKLVLHDQCALTEITASVSNTQKGLIIPEVKAKAGGGTIVAGFSRKPSEPGPPFTLKLNLENVNLAQAARDADAPVPNLDGILTGTLLLRGVGDNRKLLTGKGSLTLRDGTCREMETIHDVGTVFNTGQFTNFAITEAKSDFEIGMDRIFIHSLDIKAPPFEITASGSSHADGKKLNLNAIFHAEENIVAKQSPEIQTKFSPPDEKHMRGVAFDIEGALTKPKNNLVEKVTGTKDRKKQKIIGIESLIFSTRPDKKPDDEMPQNNPQKKP